MRAFLEALSYLSLHICKTKDLNFIHLYMILMKSAHFPLVSKWYIHFLQSHTLKMLFSSLLAFSLMLLAYLSYFHFFNVTQSLNISAVAGSLCASCDVFSFLDQGSNSNSCHLLKLKDVYSLEGKLWPT